jgi:hypothetical protein
MEATTNTLTLIRLCQCSGGLSLLRFVYNNLDLLVDP